MSDSNHSFIHDIRIATPCKANWDEMTGDECARFCHMCKLNVYNISEMTIVEAEELIIGKEGRVCLRLFRRPDGTVITKDCPVGIAAVKRRLATIYGSLTAVVSFAVLWLLNMGKPVPQVGQPMMGEVAPIGATMGGASVPAVRMGKVSIQHNATGVWAEKGRAVMGDMVMPDRNAK